MIDAEKELDISLTEIGNVQEMVWDSIKRGENLTTVVKLLEESIVINPKILRAVLSNYYIFSDVALNMNPEELGVLMDRTRVRRS